MMNIACSFIQYIVCAVILVACALGGLAIGKTMRKNKDLKNQQDAE